MLKFVVMRTFKRINFTKEGVENLVKEKARLLAERPAAVKELTRAREMGDLSENGLYRAAKSRLISIDASLRRISTTLKLADIKTPSKEIVGIGSKVAVEENDTQTEYQIVGPHEANPANKKISENSPIGRMLIGRKVGQTVTIRTPAKILTLTIKSIS